MSQSASIGNYYILIQYHQNISAFTKEKEMKKKMKYLYCGRPKIWPHTIELGRSPKGWDAKEGFKMDYLMNDSINILKPYLNFKIEPGKIYKIKIELVK